MVRQRSRVMGQRRTRRLPFFSLSSSCREPNDPKFRLAIPYVKGPEVQEMAVDTFLKISQKCRRKFVAHQTGEPQPFVEQLLAHVREASSPAATCAAHSQRPVVPPAVPGDCSSAAARLALCGQSCMQLVRNAVSNSCVPNSRILVKRVHR